MKRIYKWLLAFLAVAIVTLAIVFKIIKDKLFHPEMAPSFSVENVQRLNNEDWKEEDRQTYYHTSQGSRVMPHKWLIALEWLKTEDLFFSDSVISQLRFIPNPSKVNNPDGLPVGWALTDPEPKTGIVYAGLSCAACHTQVMKVKDQMYYLEGGAGMVDINTFLLQIVLSAYLTGRDSDKFDRFAIKVLGDEVNDPAKKKQLKKDLKTWTNAKIEEQLAVGAQGVVADGLVSTIKITFQDSSGFGRLDALGQGGNTLYGYLNKKNLKTLNANVGIPSLWYAHEYDWVQLNGSIRQPTARNIIEAMAVNALVMVPGSFYGYDPKDKKNQYQPADKYASNIKMEKLYDLENNLTGFEAPSWPFEKPDQQKVGQGRNLYLQHCADCHAKKREVFPADPLALAYDKTYYVIRLFCTDTIGTDSFDAVNFATRTADAIALFTQPGSPVPGPIIIDSTIAGAIARNFKEQGIPDSIQHKISFYRANWWRAPKSYPARPLAGVWATAPYLHNNSIRNLFELLSPSSERSNQFYLGTLEYDVDSMGYVNEKIKGSYVFKSNKEGNSNSGHEFSNRPGRGVVGPELRPDERMAIIEFLKTLKFEEDDYEDYFPNSEYARVRHRADSLKIANHKVWYQEARQNATDPLSSFKSWYSAAPCPCDSVVVGVQAPGSYSPW